MRWLPRVLVVVSLLLLLDAALSRDGIRALVALLALAFWGWTAWAGQRAPAERPEVDEDRVRAVLRAAGDPTGVRAVKALREAEPALGMLQAKQLVDAVEAA